MLPRSVPSLAAEISSELAQQSAALARLAEAGAEGLVVVDTHGRCVFLNELAGTLGGSAVANHRARSASAYLSRLFQHNRLIDDDAESARDGLQDIAALTASGRRLQIASSGKDVLFPAHEQHYTLAAYPLYNDPGTLIGYALFLRSLAPLVPDESLEDGLLSSVSHDLRTPLMVIKAAVTGLLQEGLQWDEALRRETLQDINEEADRLTTLVSALLEMSRIQSGVLRLQTEWCDLAEIIHTVLDRLQKVTRRHEIVYDVTTPLPLIQGDFMQLDRVLSNLIENAVKYSPEGTEVRVTVSLAETEVLVSVLDQGYGVPPEERERIFEKFYRLKQRRACPTRPEGQHDGSLGGLMPALAGGSGLGLAICRGIVLAHHGRIWVEARAEGGSRFVFTLPVEQSAPMTGRVAHDSGPFGEYTQPTGMPESETPLDMSSGVGKPEDEGTDETA